MGTTSISDSPRLPSTVHNAGVTTTAGSSEICATIDGAEVSGANELWRVSGPIIIETKVSDKQDLEVDSATQSKGQRRRQGRTPGSRSRRELRDSEGFALQWNAAHGPLGLERFQMEQGPTRNTARAHCRQHSASNSHDNGDASGELHESSKQGATSSNPLDAAAGEPPPKWARATRRCLRLHTSLGSMDNTQTCVSIGPDCQVRCLAWW